MNNILLTVGLAVLILSPSFASAALPSGFQIESIAEGLNVPTALAFPPDGRIFVAEKNGTVRVLLNDVLLATPLLVLTDVNTYGDRGLIGMAVDPNFSANGYLYLSYAFENTPGTNYAGTKTVRIVRVTVVGNIANESSKVVLVGTVGGDIARPSCQNFLVTADCIPSDSSSHSAGGLRFGPDGKLYASLGDGSHFDFVDPAARRAQDIDSLAGKLLRINPDGTAPSDNPFFDGDPTSNRSKVFAYGLRNMFRFNFMPGTNMLFGGDVGWSTWEEVNRIVPGGNYGWPCREGAFANAPYACAVPSAQDPIYAYRHDALGAGSITLGAFPAGSAYPAEFTRTLFFGDYAQNTIQQLSLGSSGEVLGISPFAVGADGPDGPVEFLTGPDGNVYFLSIYTGAIKRITHTLGNRTPIVALAADRTAGLAPLSIAFSSAGTLDPDGNAITWQWDFGDGAVASTANPIHVYTANGSYIAKLTVRDTLGATRSQSMVITVGDQRPSAQISAPRAGALYLPGATIALVGEGVDPEDGVLSGARLSWRIMLHHNTHVHILETSTGNTSSMVGPDHADPSVYAEVELTATDLSGLSRTTSVNIYLDNGAGQSGNLIQNPSFEATNPLNTSLPYLWSSDLWGDLSAVFSYPVVGSDGDAARAAEVRVTRYVTGDAKWTFSPAFVGEQTAMVFSDRYHSDVPTSLVAEIGLEDGTRRYIALGDVSPSTSWATAQASFVTPAGTRTVGVFHVIGQVGILTVDDFSLRVAPPPAPVNLIVNPSFEVMNGTLPLGWTPSGWGPNERTFRYPVAGRTGARAAETALVAYTDGDTKWIPDPVAITPGVEYTYSDWYTADDISDIIGRYTMQDGTFVYFGVAKELPPTASWRHASGNFIPPTSARAITFLHLISSIATLAIDDASLTESVGEYVDIEHPAVTITAPRMGDVVSGTVEIAADAIDNIGIASVEFRVDGVALGSPDTLAPYTAGWNTAGFSSGTHTITAIARDGAGITATHAITVTVSGTANLIANASLETAGTQGSPLGWLRGNWGSNTAVFTYPVPGASSPVGAEIRMDTYINGDAKWYFTPVPITEGVRYSLSGSYHASVPTRLVVQITQQDGTLQYLDLGEVPPGAAWTTFQKQFLAPPLASSVTVFHLLDRVGTLAIDQFALVALSGTGDPDQFARGMVSLSFDDGWISHAETVLPILNTSGLPGSFGIISSETLDALPYNRIANPSLESLAVSGDPIDWKRGSWGANDAAFRVTSPGFDGTSAGAVTISQYESGDAKWYFEDVTVIDGADYMISDRYRADVPTIVTMRYSIGGVFSYADIAVLPPSATWTAFSRVVAIPAFVESVTFFHRIDRVGTLAIDSANLSKVQIFVSPADVRAMASGGHEIAAHTRTHASLTDLTPGERTSEIDGSRGDLLGLGVLPVDVLVYPYGDYDPNVIAAAKAAGFVAGRSADPGSNTRSTDRFALKVMQIEVTTPVSEVVGWIDAALRDRTWLVIMFHQVDHTGKQLSMDPAKFQAVVDSLVAKQVPVVTIAEGVAAMN